MARGEKVEMEGVGWEGSSGLPETERGSAQPHSPSLGGRKRQSAKLDQPPDSPSLPPPGPRCLALREGMATGCLRCPAW